MDKWLDIRAGWFFEGNGNPAVKNRRMRVKNGVVMPESVLRGEDPAAVEPLFFKNDTVLPCLIDAHVHLVMSGTDDPATRRIQLGEDYGFAAAAVAKHLRQHRKAGILAVRDAGDRYGHALRYKVSSHRSPHCYPLLKVAGIGWKQRERYGGLVAGDVTKTTSLEQEISKEKTGQDFVKIVQSGLNSLTCFGQETTPQFDLAALRGACHAARKRGLGVMVHANGKKAVGIALAAGCHSIEHGFFMGRDNLERMADQRVVWVPTAHTMEAYAGFFRKGAIEADTCRRNLEHQLDQMRAARELGVAIAVGTDAGSLWVHHGRSIVSELRLLMLAGFPTETALACCSANGSRLLRLNSDGTLLPGRPASFIVVPGPPSDLPESLNDIVAVYMDGERVEG